MDSDEVLNHRYPLGLLINSIAGPIRECCPGDCKCQNDRHWSKPLTAGRGYPEKRKHRGQWKENDRHMDGNRMPNRNGIVEPVCHGIGILWCVYMWEYNLRLGCQVAGDFLACESSQSIILKR